MTSSPSFPSLSSLDSALPDTQLAPLPSPFAPFSRLPFELVEAIIHSTVPRHYNSRTYWERRRTLLSICLVCRTFHEIAKPLLFAIAVVREDLDEPGWKTWQEEDPSSPCQELVVVEKSWPEKNKLPRVKPLIQAHLQLKVLVFDMYDEEICLADLDCLTNLSVLRLTATKLIGERPFTFPNLSELSIVELGPVNVLPWGNDRARYPALRALDSYWIFYSHHPLLEHLISMLSDQLELLHIQQTAIARISSTTFEKIKHKTVFWANGVQDFTIGAVQILRLSTLVITATAVDQLENFTSQLFKSPISSLPSVLYLPTRINPENSSTQDAPFVTASGILLSKCQEHKIEVVFEENEAIIGFDSPFSVDFCRRMKKERLEKEGGAK
ncbi:hypothetical protein JCM3765_003158 [Sporobolomyces pararoseus]